jgi:flavin reductase (DIM6/NTAB) family NADH-FMN oxidoreductase RutF
MSADTQSGTVVSIDSPEFRRMVDCLPTGVVIISTARRDGGAALAMTQAFTMASFDPPLVLWAIKLWSRNFPDFRDARMFAVNILSDQQRPIALALRDGAEGAGPDLPLMAGHSGTPMLEGCSATLECFREATNLIGGNVAIVGRIERYSHFPERPALISYRGEYVTMGRNP